jgi:ABC-type transporter Mla subunit MlaD
MGDKSAEIRAGIVVLIALAILGAGLFIVSGGWERFEDKELYTIHFPNVGGLGRGDTVLLAGQKAGSVKEVDNRAPPQRRDGELQRFVAVTIELSAGSEIPVDSVFKISKTITNVATLHIDRGKAKELADSESKLFGSRRATFDETVDSAMQKLGTAEEAILEFKGLMVDARAKIKDLDFARIQSKIENILDTIQSAVTEIETAVKSDEGLVRQALVDLKATAANLEKFSSDLKGDWPEIEGKVQTILDNVKEASADIKGILKENRPDVRTLVQNVKDASHRIAPLLESFEGVGKEANAALVELRPDLVRAVKTAGKAFDNFEAVTEDLKTAPWKLINKPSESESDDVHLYNAARLYVDAAGRINENIEDLDTLRRLGVLDDPSRADLIARTLAILQQSLKEFEERERKLVRLIQARTGN